MASRSGGRGVEGGGPLAALLAAAGVLLMLFGCGNEALSEVARNPCQGRVVDRLPHPMTPLAKPRPGASYRDPAFGTWITRITDANPAEGENAVIKPLYSTMPAWNADESLLLLWHRGRGYELYQGDAPYGFLRALELRSPSDIEQVLWDPVDPALLYYPSNYNAEPLLIEHRVTPGGSWRVLHDFRRPPTNCPVDWGRLLRLGSDPQWMSWDGRRILGLQCGDTKFLYSISEDAVLAAASTSVTRNAPIAAPSGTLAFLDGHVLDLRLRSLRQLVLANPFEHASIGRDRQGHDLWNAVAFDGTEIGSLVSHRLDTGERRIVIGPPNGYPYPLSSTHLSAVSQRAPGWVALGMVGSHTGRTLLDNEVVLANVDTGEVCRVAHARTFAGTTSAGRWGYWSETHVVISPTATRILFGSDWLNGASVDSYVVDLRRR